MTIYYNAQDRKPLVKAISEFTGADAIYMRTPTYAYQIDYFTVTREGNRQRQVRIPLLSLAARVHRLSEMGVLQMKFPSKEQIEHYRREYPVGCRVELVSMEDFQAPPVGTEGTVLGVDDTGSLIVKWDNGSHLNVIYGEDTVIKL